MSLAVYENETPSRLDKMGTQFMEDPDSVDCGDAFELLSDLLGVAEKDMACHFQGRQYVPEDKIILEK